MHPHLDFIEGSSELSNQLREPLFHRDAMRLGERATSPASSSSTARAGSFSWLLAIHSPRVTHPKLETREIARVFRSERAAEQAST